MMDTEGRITLAYRGLKCQLFFSHWRCCHTVVPVVCCGNDLGVSLCGIKIWGPAE